MQTFTAILLRTAIALALAISYTATASSEADIKVVYLKADWCPPCARLGPRLTDALLHSPSEKVERLDLDMSALRGQGKDVKWQTIRALKQQVAAQNVSYIWDWYGGYPGLVVVTAADNGEPLTCITSDMPVSEMKDRLQESLILASITAPGKRRLHGTDCPAPRRNQTLN